MSEWEKRLHISLNEERADGAAEGTAAAWRLLDRSAEPQGTEPAWSESKSALEADLDSKFG